MKTAWRNLKARHANELSALRGAGTSTLRVCVGSTLDGSFALRTAGPIVRSERKRDRIAGTITSWSRIVVRFTGCDRSKEVWVIIPSDEENAIQHGDFYVRGRFRIEARSNHPELAGKLWRSTNVE
jgi:hypothetical protein